jgi:hypothetical protein
VKAAWLAAGILALCGCSGQGAPAPRDTVAPATSTAPPVTANAPASSSPAPVHVAHVPPTAKDIIDAVTASGGVPLSVSPTCHSIGTETSDATIGRFLAGFLAELSSPDKKNWIETAATAGKSAAGEDVSVCRLVVRHEDGDDRWGWGVQFQVRTRDRLVLQESFTCLGAG